MDHRSTQFHTVTTPMRDQADDLARIIADGKHEDLIAFVSSREAIDVAAATEELDEDDLRTLVDMLPTSSLCDLMTNAEDDLRLRIAQALDDQLLLMVLTRMNVDDEVDILAKLDPSRANALLSNMRDADRIVLMQLLHYPDKTAGSIMTTSFISVREDRTVADCLAIIQAKGTKIEQIQTIYVIGMQGKLAGYLDLRKILSSSRELTVRNIMETRLVYVDPYTDQEDAAMLVARYNLNALPVVSGNKLLGIITVDDIIDVIIDEYDEDLLHLSGASAEETLDSNVLQAVRMRLPWLLVNLGTAFLASFVVKLFESTIEQVVALSAIMTIVSGMGGNAGSQTMAIAVRHLSKDDVTPRDTRRTLRKEILAGMVNGAVNGVITGVVVAIIYGNAYLALVVLAAMVGNMVIAGIFGLLVPVVLKAFHQDPAVSSSIFVTTATDVLGFLIFLGLARVFLPLLA